MKDLVNLDITRLELINHNSPGEKGRVFVLRGEEKINIEFQLQDDNKTLKIFI